MQVLHCCYHHFVALQHLWRNASFCTTGVIETGREGVMGAHSYPSPWMSPINLCASFPKHETLFGSIRRAFGLWVTILAETEQCGCFLPLAQSDLW